MARLVKEYRRKARVAVRHREKDLRVKVADNVRVAAGHREKDPHVKVADNVRAAVRHRVKDPHGSRVTDKHRVDSFS